MSFLTPPSAALLFWILTLPSLVESPVTLSERPRAGIARQAAAAQPPATKAETSGREFFVSWGYNGDRYGNSDIHFSEPSLGNEFTLHGNVRIRDSKGWTDGLFAHSLTVPQYNIRIGFFFNEKWASSSPTITYGVEVVRGGPTGPQDRHLNGAPADGDVALTADVLRYQLNNGESTLLQPDSALAADG